MCGVIGLLALRSGHMATVSGRQVWNMESLDMIVEQIGLPKPSLDD